MRFFAALMVFLWHATTFIGTDLFFNHKVGYAGVGFFYILSGFILTYVYLNKLKKPTVKAVKKFYIARIAKLFPVHLLTFLASLPLLVTVIHDLIVQGSILKLIGAAGVNLTLLQSWFPQASIHFSFNSVAWSISVELFFYALFPLIIFILTRSAVTQSIKNILLMMAALWVIGVAVYVPISSMLDDWIIYIFPPARLIDFVMGVLLALVFIKLPTNSITSVLRTSREWSIAEIASILLLVGGFAFSVMIPQSLRFALWLMPFWMVIIFIFSHDQGIISRFLKKRPLVFLGEISFSFYMVHQLIIRYVSTVEMSHAAVVALSFMITICVSSVVYLVFEEPLRLKLKAFLEEKLIPESPLFSRLLNKLRNA
jgi:peptidoglycan/LPS O-acetylase OafA/YrhL